MSLAICRMVDAEVYGGPNDGNNIAEKPKCWGYPVKGLGKSDPDRQAYVWAVESRKLDDYSEVDDSYCANTYQL